MLDSRCAGGIKLRLFQRELVNMNPLMNNTKWNEIRNAMYGLNDKIQWRTKDIENGYISNWDAEWYYHFIIGGFNTIEWLEIKFTSKNKEKIISELVKIHVPGKILDETIIIYGYSEEPVDYI
jgi:hypothetical protein